MTVSVIEMKYFTEISGTTSEVQAVMVSRAVTDVQGYHVDHDSGTRYILARKTG